MWSWRASLPRCAGWGKGCQTTPPPVIQLSCDSCRLRLAGALLAPGKRHHSPLLAPPRPFASMRSCYDCCVQEEIIPVAAEYDRTMKYPQPVFEKAFEVWCQFLSASFERALVAANPDRLHLHPRHLRAPLLPAHRLFVLCTLLTFFDLSSAAGPCEQPHPR